MNEQELDLSKINAIDMECSPDEDDDGFGGFSQPDSKKSDLLSFDNEPEKSFRKESDGREVESKTGIILNFGDEEYNVKPKELEVVSEPITAQLTDSEIDINAPIHPETGFIGYNQIDMECSVGDDDCADFGETTSPVKHSGDFVDFDDDDDVDVKELVDDEIISESTTKYDTQIDQGKVEADYYDKLKKKHAKTNKKGAYNAHFHFAGDPKWEMDEFNHMNTPKGPIPNVNTATTVGAGDSNMTVAAQGMGMAEDYKKLFEELLVITGFELQNCEDGKCVLKDKYSTANDSLCSTTDDLKTALKPYISDFFIIPLQMETGEKFDNCHDWVAWYTPEMQSKFPQCKKDIAYCDLCDNHLQDCKVF